MNPVSVGRVYLGLSALVYLGLGLWLSVDPEGPLSGLGLRADGAVARTELRAMYGGLELGVGLWLVIAAARRAWLAPGLALVAASLGGLGSLRVLGLLLEGEGLAAHAPLLASEVLGTAGALGLLVWLARAGRGEAPRG